MNIEIPHRKIYTRKADKQGRISLPTSKYANKKLEIAVLDTKQEKWERRKDTETGNRVYVWWHTDRDDEVQVIREEPKYFTIQGIRGGYEYYDIDTAESAGDAYEKAVSWMEKNPRPD